MNEPESQAQAADLVLEFELDASPERVWKAISDPELRENWLPGDVLAEAEPISSTQGEEVRYRMRDNEPPFLESLATFQVRPNADGGTTLRIVHGLADERLVPRTVEAANNNASDLLMAA